MRTASLCFAFCALLIAACDRPSAAQPLHQVFQCGQLVVAAEFPTPDNVKLAWPGHSLTLKRVPAASGAKYSDSAGNEFWTKDGALLTLAGQPTRQCTLT